LGSEYNPIIFVHQGKIFLSHDELGQDLVSSEQGFVLKIMCITGHMANIWAGNAPDENLIGFHPGLGQAPHFCPTHGVHLFFFEEGNVID
jgi:hypothetical protein